MKRLFTLLAVFTAITFGATAQRVCGSNEHHEHLLQTDPDYAHNQEMIENHTNDFLAHHDGDERSVITIPVVFHVVYNTAAQNVSNALINAQLTQLNLDFARLNSDWTSTPSVFQSSAANTNIQFCLATVDPSGNPTTGIQRKQTTTTSFSTNDGVKSGSLTATSGGISGWPSSSYLNVWVCNQSGGILGYAQFPGGASATDGVVLHFTTVGSVASPNTAGAPYNLGRTATHEVGHWLNLRHIWGDANCGNDQVADTPTQQTSNYGCPTFPKVTCSNGPNGDMFMNYMDYTNDACMYMFTNGQASRMQALFAAGGSRASLLNSAGCGTPVGCGTPGSLAAASITTTGATISWGAVSGATSYNVQYKLGTATTWTTVTSATTSLAISGLTAATTYNYQVQAVCASGTGAYSTAASFTTSSTAVSCGTPTGLASSLVTSTGATVSWTSVTGATSYNVQYKTNAATTWTTVTSTTTSRAITGLTASTAYLYQIQAVCTSGTSAFSSQGSFTTSAATACSDIYESNNSLSTAKVISINTTITARIGSSTDRDYFSFTTTTAAPKIRIDLTNLPADYDVRLYNSSGTQIGISQNSGTTAEVIRFNTATTGGTYRVYVYGYSGAFNASLCYNLRVSTGATNFREGEEVDAVVSNENVPAQLEVVAVYPNPTSDELNVTFNSATEGAINITLTDISGREIFTNRLGAVKGMNKTQFNMADFASGYYTLIINDGITRSSVKVVKK
jgi:hypothetical protein